MIGFKGEDFI